MPTYLSPGVYPREIDIAPKPAAVGPLRPVFVGTASKGPMNTPILCSSAQQAVDVFGLPFPESYMMYAVLSFMEEGNQCYIIRVGIEAEEGQDASLAEVAIDTSGTRLQGWGRVPLFTGIDYGRITLRAATAANPVIIHASSVSAVEYNDQAISTTDGATTATLDFTAGSDGSDEYTGCIDDNFIVVITGDPDEGEALEGATYEVIRNSDNVVLASGTLTDLGGGTSANIDLGNGLVFSVVVTAGALETNDTFTFSAAPDNRTLAVSVEGGTAIEKTIAAGTYSTASALVAALNTAIGVGDDYLAVSYTQDDGTIVAQLRTRLAGRRIQLTSSCAFAAEVGVQQYAWDIPRSYLIGTDAGPYAITSQNNRVVLNAIPQTGATKRIEFSINVGTGLLPADIVAAVDAAGTVGGSDYFESFVLTVPGGSQLVVIATHLDRIYDQLQLVANFSQIKTMRFSEQLGIMYPYTRGYRGYWDNRTQLPAASATDPSTPASCSDPLSDDCANDMAYYANIVGWIVATSPGTWIDNYTVSVELQTTAIEASGAYQITVKDASGAVVDIIQNVSFDKAAARYIGNVINPGTTLGGVSGNDYINWDERPAYLANDPTETSYEIRQPAVFASREFAGTRNGIPIDPAYSSALDAAVIGSAYNSSGMYGVQNNETYDVNLLLTPGFTSGSVIGQGLQLCERRGDMLYIVDPPFGLRPQQVTDWHNGMLSSDLGAAINSSYGALYWSWLKIADTTNLFDIWVPPSGHVAAIYARSAKISQWSAPAGTERGRILTPKDVEYNPGLGDRDLMYGSGNAVNALVKLPGQGIVIMGQKTLQRTNTPLNRVNVRMLLIHIKKTLTATLRDFVFKPNDPITWSQVINVVDPFLADIQSNRGLEAYRVICDSSVNTPARIQQLQLWVSILLKVQEVAEFIVLNLGVLQSTASFVSDETLAAVGVVG